MAERGVSNGRRRLSTADMLLGVSGIDESRTVPSSADNGVELDESDVVWSGDYGEEAALSEMSRNTKKTLTPRVSKTRQGFEELSPGLSVVLSEGGRGLRRSNLSKTGINIPSNNRSVSSAKKAEEYSGRYHRSAPVNVPLWSLKPRGPLNGQGFGNFGEDDEDDENEDERLPPHEIMARQQSRDHFSTFSVLEGRGRTLKGSDITRVRDAVWSRTGFAG